MSAPQLTVALCTRNPRPAFLAETLAALAAQTLPASEWELLIVDNASQPPLARTAAWPARTRLVLEPIPGIAPARLQAAATAATDLLVFVDDDNLLAPDYLATALRLLAAEPTLGCFGGSLLPRFETPPPAWTRRYWDYLAIKPLAADRLAAHPFDYPALPPTAGMVVRRPILARYAALFAAEPARRTHLHSRCEDLDIAITAAEIGYRVGRFAALRLEHLMPAARLAEDNLLRLWHDSIFATTVLEACHGRPPPPAPHRFVALAHRLRCWRLPRRARRFALAELAARHAGRAAALTVRPPC